MILDQPLPQHPGPPWPLPTADGIPAITSFTVDDVQDFEQHARKSLETVRADADEQIHSLRITAARLAEERDEARREADRQRLRGDGIEAGALALTADHIRREDALQARVTAAEADRDEARRERNVAKANARISDEITAAMSQDLHEKHLELRRTCEQVVGATGEIARLQTELDATTTALAEANVQLAAKRRFRRRH